ncbi:hypothetical protein GbCGDNIH7_8330 [Granulibacter bethesdensis]|nr:hypothetical protein GbCGDNIH7_8330 [Granulibacter bethesdensis]
MPEPDFGAATISAFAAVMKAAPGPVCPARHDPFSSRRPSDTSWRCARRGFALHSVP